MLQKVNLIFVDKLMYIATYKLMGRLAPVLKTIFHQCVISYTCSQSNSGGSVLNRAIRDRLAISI